VDHYPDHHSVLLLRQQRLGQWLWLQQRLRQRLRLLKPKSGAIGAAFSKKISDKQKASFAMYTPKITMEFAEI